jgi:DNA polymerase III subunit delta'
MLFKEVIGQEEIKKRLTLTVHENRISHALLFLGPEGSGNLALALAYAQFISCTNRQQDDSCGVCPSCQKYHKLIHPDLHFVYPVATTKSVDKNPVSDNFITDWRMGITKNPYMTLSQWYELIGIENKQGNIGNNEAYEILRKLSLKSYESDYKIMIIWMPEKLNITAANKLLKIIEEPPPKTLFLMVGENSSKLLPTILSRTQLVKIPKINDESMRAALASTSNLPEQALNNIVHLALGNYNHALTLLESNEENNVNFDLFVRLMRLGWTRKMAEIFQWVDEVSSLGRERQKNFLLEAMRLLRENFLRNQKLEEMVHMTDQENEFANNFNKFIKPSNISSINDELNKAYADIEWNGYAKFIFLDLLLKISRLLKM